MAKQPTATPARAVKRITLSENNAGGDRARRPGVKAKPAPETPAADVKPETATVTTTETKESANAGKS